MYQDLGSTEEDECGADRLQAPDDLEDEKKEAFLRLHEDKLAFVFAFA